MRSNMPAFAAAGVNVTLLTPFSVGLRPPVKKGLRVPPAAKAAFRGVGALRLHPWNEFLYVYCAICRI